MDLMLNSLSVFTVKAINATIAFWEKILIYRILSSLFTNICTIIVPNPIFDSANNILNFKNSDLIEISINLYLPDNLKNNIKIKSHNGKIFFGINLIKK